MILFKIWLFKLSDIDQGIHKDDIQKKQKFCAFWRKLLGEKENSLTLLCLGLQCFFWKGLCDFKIQFAVEKIFFWCNYKITRKHFCVAIKSVNHTISIYGSCMIRIFSKNSKPRFFSSPDCFIRIKQPQKLRFKFFQPFIEIVLKCYDKHFPVHLMHGIIWSFGVWRPTWVV